MTTEPSQVHQSYQREFEAAINQQINMELYAAYVYLSMAYHFDREDVALKNFATYFLGHLRQEQEHAEMLLRLQNQRRGHIQLHDIRKPDLDDWGSGLNAIEYAFHLEQTINQSLVDLHKMAMEKDELQLCDFLERHFLLEQVRIIKELGYHVNKLCQLRASGGGPEEYIFNSFTLSDSDEEN
ncbi:ferritin heavy chain-like [Orycteropus afer afer]|uniref:Ferritin n=1 Tax=Orycteropus afer afer TaxID=1230840 RepID=A0A8B7B608_ORYAF|nr:ferritin heavy chain-like [Orycteropus afer afer]